MRSNKRLGEMLLENKLLTEEQLQKALAEERKDGLKLGQYLVREGIVVENQIIDLLCQRLNIEKYHPDKYPVDMGLAELIPWDVAKNYHVAPLRIKGRLLAIATIDPLNIDILDNIEGLIDFEVEPVFCTEQEIHQLMNSIYGIHSEINDNLEGMAIESYIDEDQIAEQMTSDVLISTLKTMSLEAPVMRLVNSIFAEAVRVGASDVHISPKRNNCLVRFRIDGKLHDGHRPPKTLFLPIVARIKILASIDITVSRIPQDGRFTLRLEKKEINVRVSTMPTTYGENVVLRLLDMSLGIYTLDRLGMVRADTEKIATLIHKPYGMILSTGPTGCGKSSSLYAILHELDRSDINIVTLEDPVEYRIESICQTQLNSKAGMTFSSGLRAILRQDPEVIMVGEIRDQETAAIAIQAAQTGHLLLSTLHTNNAAGAIARLIYMGIEPYLISSVLLMSFAQRLVRTNCSYCKEPHQPPVNVLAAWGIENVENRHFMKGRGCNQCMNTGYKGRTGLFEVLVNDEVVQDMIIKKSSAEEITRTAVQAGKLRTLKEDAVSKVLLGITTLEEAASAVSV